MKTRLTLSLSVLIVSACAGAPPTPPPACAAGWATEAAVGSVSGIVAATASDRPVWGTYGLGDGWYVLQAGESDQGETCVGLFRDGEAVAYTALPDAPKLLTPLYGYYFAGSVNADSGLVATSRQPPSVHEWLQTLGVERAIVMPVDFPNFPIAMTALFKTQLAIHEGFHVMVQAPRWYEATGPWPAWDRQPDRAGVQACYDANLDALEEERASLVSLIGALLDSDTTAACSAGRQFLERRAARYEALGDVSVTLHDGTAGTCSVAEAIMELEEGTADYASWSVLYDIGQATRDDLLRRYRAQQQDMYYVTGAMQLHAAQLMASDGMTSVVEAIEASRGPEDGSLTAMFRSAVGGFCR